MCYCRICCGIYLAGIVFFTGCNSEAQKNNNDKERFVISDSPLKTLQIDTVQACQLVNSITLTGKVAFNENNVSKIYPLVSGTINDIKVMVGDYVNKGQVLAIVNSPEMAGLSNDLINAQTNLEVARKNADATNDMYKSGLSSGKDLLAAQASYEQARSESNRVTRILKINGGNTQGENVIRAPISGFVVEKFATNKYGFKAR